ncbi:MAG: nucleotidyltransferase domain-containing protein [Zestosphaera sp.]
MSNAFNIYVEKAKKFLRVAENPHTVAKEIKELAKNYWPEAKVYIFGSIARGKYTAGSDIDILIVAESCDTEEKYRFKAKIAMTTDLPIQLHIVTKKEFEKWYLRFIPLTELIEI